MNQALLDLDPLALAPIDPIGFDIGFDHAHHGLVPPPELLQGQTAVGQGWLAGKAVYGRRAVQTARNTRLWLALRLRAWEEGMGFDPQQLTRLQLAQIEASTCPVRRTPLGGARGHADAAVIERLDPLQGYRAGNLVMMSVAASRAWQGISSLQARRLARRCEGEATGGSINGLDSAGWWRVAVLRTLATRLPFHQVVEIPLALWPPAQVAIANPAQRLQALVTAQFGSAGFSTRTRRLAALLPEGSLRHDFNLFVAALAPRVLEADGRSALRAVEDAWLNERVQRRWQHFMLSLGEAGCEALLRLVGQRGQTRAANNPAAAMAAAA
ncbi:MAG: hypothetical protein ABIN96_04660 [Rubrivivax sp.]